MSARFRHGMGWGATLREDGGCVFRLWAPGCDSVTLEIDGQPPVPMRLDAGGWFQAEALCGAGSRYRYRISPELAVPDPASRRQPDDVHGPSEVVDPLAYEWQHPRWCGRPWTEAVIYELHVGAFGGFDGVREQLPRLAAQGFTAIELMPIAEFPGSRNWGYDGVLPYAPESSYGDPASLKRLVDAAHGLGLMVYLDVVYNHFGPDGNYLHSYAPQFFREDVQTPWGAAIDFRRPEVRDYFIQNALYWLLEYRFDGLRFDAVHAINDSAFLDALAAAVRETIGDGRHVHLMLENEHNDAERLRRDYDAQWDDDFHNALHVLLTGETESYYRNYADAPAQQLARCLSEGFAYQGEPSPSHEGRPRGTPSADLPPSAFITFVQNHDQVGNRALGERLSQLVPAAALDAAIALQLLSPQIPLVFMGEEVGSRKPFLFFTDFHKPELADAVREGRRKEFADFAAFADPASRERIPDPNAPATFQQSIPESGPADEEGQRRAALYRELLRLRREHLVPRLAGTRSLGASVLAPRAILARWRLGDGSTLAIAVNFGEQRVALAALPGMLLHESAAGAAARLAQGELPAQALCAYLEDVSG